MLETKFGSHDEYLISYFPPAYFRDNIRNIIMADNNDDVKLYHYNPSVVAAVIFIVLFACTTGLHTYQFIRTRTWIMIPLLIGGFSNTKPPPYTFQTPLTEPYSGSHRLRLPHHQQPGGRPRLVPRPLHSASRRPADCAHPLYRYHLHDLGSHYPACRWLEVFHDSEALAHEDICRGGYTESHNAVDRYEFLLS